jgi:hypothetical protein
MRTLPLLAATAAAMVIEGPIHAEFSGVPGSAMPAVAGLSDLMGLLERAVTEAALPRPQRAKAYPSHPCTADEKRFQCTSTPCLLEHVNELSPYCKTLITKHTVTVPDASPGPPNTASFGGVTFTHGEDLKEPYEPPKRHPTASIGGISFTDEDGNPVPSPAVPIPNGGKGMVASIGGISFTDEDGNPVPRSAVLGLKAGADMARREESRLQMISSMGEMVGMLFPPSLIRTMLGDVNSDIEVEVIRPSQQKQPVAEAKPASARPPSAHPCAREVDICTRETKSSSRTAIEGCLLKHFSELSASCKCFVHQVTGTRVPAAQVRPEPTSVQVVGASIPTAVGKALPGAGAIVTVLDLDVEEVPTDMTRVRRAHSLSCLLMMTLVFLVAILILRRLYLACCSRKKRLTVVIPPQPASITSVEPLSCREIKQATKTPEPSA